MSPDQPSDGRPNTDLLTEIEFETADPAYFPVGLSSASACEVSLEEQLQLDDGTFAEYYTASGCVAEAVCEHAEGDPSVGSVSILGPGDGGPVFRLHTGTGWLPNTLERAGALTTSALATDGTGRVVAQVFPVVDAPSVIEAVLEAHPTSELVARRFRPTATLGFTRRGLQQLVRDRLTARQWEVLQRAYRDGYFEQPREHTGEAIADTLDISSATFSQHLRSAQRNILSVLIEEPADTAFD